MFARNFPKSAQSHVLGSKASRRFRAGLTGIATFSPVVAGAILVAGLPGAPYWLIPAEIASLYLSIGNAWVFAIEIPRRHHEKRKALTGE